MVERQQLEHTKRSESTTNADGTGMMMPWTWLERLNSGIRITQNQKSSRRAIKFMARQKIGIEHDQML
jgi:hypothetical protein